MNDVNHLTLPTARFGDDRLLHPAQEFEHPRDVAEHPDLSLDEKRAILASWASDACAVEAAPGLRRPPGSRRVITVDEILAALCSLDRAAGREDQSTTTSGASCVGVFNQADASSRRRGLI